LNPRKDQQVAALDGENLMKRTRESELKTESESELEPELEPKTELESKNRIIIRTRESEPELEPKIDSESEPDEESLKKRWQHLEARAALRSDGEDLKGVRNL